MGARNSCSSSIFLGCSKHQLENHHKVRAKNTDDRTCGIGDSSLKPLTFKNASDYLRLPALQKCRRLTKRCHPSDVIVCMGSTLALKTYQNNGYLPRFRRCTPSSSKIGMDLALRFAMQISKDANGARGNVAVIIGAGPAGLTVAYELLMRTTIKPVVLEKTQQLGGISTTINYKGNRMDIGGHRFFQSLIASWIGGYGCCLCSK